MYIPPYVDVWGYGAASISSVRDIRTRFDYQVVERLLGDESDRKRWNEPLLLLYDDRLTQYADLLAIPSKLSAATETKAGHGGFDPKYYLARNVPVQSESLSKALQTFLAGFAISQRLSDV